METVLRVVVIYLFILFGMRIIGKREFGAISPLELVTLLLIPELASQALIREDFSLVNAVIAISTLLVLVFLSSAVTHMSPAAEKIMSGEPAVLVSHGKLIESSFNKERVSPEELFGEMHKAGLHDLRQIRWAILESGGRIAFVPEPTAPEVVHADDNNPVTA
ncbi:MAG: DUF421 domain-containing protein [Chloroflexi bacterium]|nr:DUF421 domain-containing protein [Chloroflexota bacterium]